MKCNQLILWEQGNIDETAWKAHAASCAQCRQVLQVQEGLAAALVPSAAPAELVEKVFAKTTRRKSWLVRWRAALAGGVVAVLVAVGVVYNFTQPTAFNATELVSYMQQNGNMQDEYSTFLSDLEILEKEF